MAPKGKGFMIWKVPNCEGGNAAKITEVAQAANLTHVHIKIADGPTAYNIEKTSGVDLVAPVVKSLHANGIQAWGWHYIYGYNPVGEAQIAIQRYSQLNLDGYVIDAEVEFKQPGRDTAARKFMSELRSGLPNAPVALCSFRFPSLHQQFPWTAFLEKCNFNMPQVYWEGVHNPGAQVRRCVQEFQNLSPVRPIHPVGPVYKSSGWVPTQLDEIEFLDTILALGLKSVNYFAWDYGRSILSSLWDTIAQFPWPTTPAEEMPQKYITALNSHDVNQVVDLYSDNAVHVTASQTIQGKDAIRSWYTRFLTERLPNGSFVLTSMSGTGSARQFTWQATSPKGKVQNGNDSLGISNGKMNYHYTYFTITS